ncbi:MAG: DedA [Chthoniobacteraceae bacterium]|nr:DedA [Chthoniobacteraceae bacterium]
MHSLIAFWFALLQKWGYLGIVVLMAMESSIFPVPSEVVIPPAAYWATQGQMSFWGVVIAGTVGSYLGSAITYWLALWLGRMVIVKFGRYFLITEEKLERAERFVHRYEAGGIFFARLLPVVRHLISIPAGIVRMNFAIFSAMTIVGSFIWCYVLAEFGTRVITADMMSDPTKMVSEIKAQSHWIIGFILLFCALYFIAMKLTAPKAAAAVSE